MLPSRRPVGSVALSASADSRRPFALSLESVAGPSTARFTLALTIAALVLLAWATNADATAAAACRSALLSGPFLTSQQPRPGPARPGGRALEEAERATGYSRLRKREAMNRRSLGASTHTSLLCVHPWNRRAMPVEVERERDRGSSTGIEATVAGDSKDMMPPSVSP